MNIIDQIVNIFKNANPMNFVSNLTYLISGMIGIFIVIGVIIISTAVLNAVTAKLANKKSSK